MRVNSISTFELMELMGSEATEREAVAMLHILERNDVADTDDVSEAQWLEFLDEAVSFCQ